MVSKARTNNERPKFINETLWGQMQAHWATEEQSKGVKPIPHRHVTGPKSYRQIQREMEIELGRAVTLGEVFVRAHTTKDGKYIDQKAERIAITYEMNLREKLTARARQNSDCSDGVEQIWNS